MHANFLFLTGMEQIPINGTIYDLSLFYRHKFEAFSSELDTTEFVFSTRCHLSWSFS